MIGKTFIATSKEFWVKAVSERLLRHHVDKPVVPQLYTATSLALYIILSVESFKNGKLYVYMILLN